MLANTGPVAFGAIGVPMIVAHQVTGIDLMSISKIVGWQLPLLSFIIPFWLRNDGWMEKNSDNLTRNSCCWIDFCHNSFLVSNFLGPYFTRHSCIDVNNRRAACALKSMETKNDIPI